MRVIKESFFGPFKLTWFSYNSKYILKLETPYLEQIYKFPEMDFSGLEELETKLIKIEESKVEELFKGMLALHRGFYEDEEYQGREL